MIMDLGLQVKQVVKEALEELPAAERVVAIALKKIYEQIKRVYDEQQKQIHSNRIKYQDLYRQIQEKTQNIIKGKKLTHEDLGNTHDYFVGEEPNNIKQTMESQQPLKNYYLEALHYTHLRHSIPVQDEEVIKHLISMTSKITDDSIEVTLTFEASAITEAGCSTRILELENGQPLRFKGDKPKFKNQLKPQTFLFDLFTDSAKPQELKARFKLVAFLVNEFIPASLLYFLGGEDYDDEEEDEDDFADEDEDEDEDEEEEDEQELDNDRKKKN